MLKISQVGKANHSVTLKLEGRVVGPWVNELGKVCKTHLAKGRALTLDLTEVSYVDREGIQALTGFNSRGVALKDCSPFVEEQLKNG